MKNPKRLIVANWKMNPKTLKEAMVLTRISKKIASELKKTELVICPPYPFLHLVKSGKNFSLGMQNIYPEVSGSFTGEIGLALAKDFNTDFVIVGHSERRKMGETNELVAQKVKQSVLSGIKTILCIGESKRDHSGEYLSFIEKQIKESLLGIRKNDLDKIIIAYEPVFTIGASFKDVMKPHDIHTMVLYIKKVLGAIYGAGYIQNVPILYGGAVSEETASGIIGEGEVGGLLVGRQSLDKEAFKKILKSVDAIPFKKN